MLFSFFSLLYRHLFIYMRFVFRSILTIIVFIFSMGTVFAQENTIQSTNPNTEIEKSSEKLSEKSETPDKSKTDIQKTINAYILEIYKFQGNKILQDLDENLTKKTLTLEAKIDAYGNIQETLELRKASVESDTKMGKNAKSLLIKYLNYMITEIAKKKTKLS